MARRFATLDVFTGTALAGNPLAVVLDAQNLPDARMQAIAREFNLSETVFVQPPEDPHNRARLRIFTPARELPFAGHPTIGTAVLLALLDHGGRHGHVAFDLEETVGIVPCAVEILNSDTGRATFTLPRLPERVGDLPDTATLAAALGVDQAEMGLSGHLPAIWSAGVPFGIVPMKNRAAVSRARPVSGTFEAAFGEAAAGHAYVYCAEPIEPTSRYHARMFAPDLGVVEDPATGSAAAAFAGAVMAAERPADGDTGFIIEQGDAMGRPSRITLGLVVENGALVRASIGGEAVLIMEGSLRA